VRASAFCSLSAAMRSNISDMMSIKVRSSSL
jgi:hypothetical protein